MHFLKYYFILLSRINKYGIEYCFVFQKILFEMLRKISKKIQAEHWDIEEDWSAENIYYLYSKISVTFW